MINDFDSHDPGRITADPRLARYKRAVLEQLREHENPEIADDLISGRTTPQYIMKQGPYANTLGASLDRATQFYTSPSDEEKRSLEQSQGSNLEQLASPAPGKSTEETRRRRALRRKSTHIEDIEDFSDVNWIGR